MLEGHLKTIRHKGDEDVRFDARVLLVVNRADGQVAFELFEGLLDLGQLNIVLPQQSGRFSGEIGTEQVTTFSTPNRSEFVSIQSKREGLRGEGLIFCWQMKVDQPVSMSRLFLGRAKFYQQTIAG